MSTWERLAGLELEVEDYALEGLREDVSSDFERLSTIIHLRGGGLEGLGEDVTYDAEDHLALQRTGPNLPLAGRYTIASFCEHLAGLELFGEPPRREVSRRYRTWAYESAALDLALGQAGLTLHGALGRHPEPVRFVVSLRLGEPPTLEPINERLENYPTLRFKLDPTSSWDEALIAGLVRMDVVDSVDFKGLYVGSIVDQPADPVLYKRVVEAFPQAWIEDPALTPETDAVLAGHRERFSWDANIHSIADIESLPYRPGMVNIKPSRLGGLETSWRPTTTAPNAGSATTGVGSSSSASAAVRTNTWHPFSTRMRPTTWPRPASTSRSRRRGWKAARWRPRRRRWASAGAESPAAGERNFHGAATFAGPEPVTSGAGRRAGAAANGGQETHLAGKGLRDVGDEQIDRTGRGRTGGAHTRAARPGLPRSRHPGSRRHRRGL